MNRATSLAELYKASVQKYTGNPEEWKGLLSCVARFYKRSFDNAVLIYAQRPNATQLGTFDEWHDRRVGRSINRGAKSIAVIDMVNPNASIKYLFDFMDTNGSVQSYRNLQKYLWELEEQYRPSILIRFQERYHTTVSSMEACLYELTDRRVREALAPYMEGFKVREEESPLYGMPEKAVKAEFTDIVIESTAYTVFSKCGLPVEMFGDGSFENISNYNSLQMFMALGNYTVSIARPILKEIFQEIQNIKMERSKIYDNGTIDGFHIQTGRGRDDVSRNQDIGESAGRPNASGTVRTTLEGVHDGETSTPAFGTGSTGEDQRNHTSSGQRGGTEERDTGTGTFAHSASAGNGGHNEESRTYEHDNERGGRNRDVSGSAENQIEYPIPPQKTQSSIDGLKPSMGDFFAIPPKTQKEITLQNTSEKPQTKAKAVELNEVKKVIKLTPQKETDVTEEKRGREEISELMDIILCADDLISDTGRWHLEICELFLKDSSQEKKADMLQVFYGELNEEYTVPDGNYQVHVLGRREGIALQIEGNEYLYSYQELIKRIDALILSGRYPFSIEKERLDDYVIPDEWEELKESRKYSEAEQGNKRGQPTEGQFSLFSIEMESCYEDKNSEDSDAILNMEELQEPEDNDIDEDSSAMTVETIQSIGFVPEQKEALQAAVQTKQVNEVYEPAGIENDIGNMTEDSNYHFSEEHHLYDGGPKTKFQNNVTAIRLLKELQVREKDADNRYLATAEEQIILAKFVGWGGLANALTPEKAGWEAQYEEIKNLMTEEEFQSAQESTMTAYYTEQSVIRHIYHALEQFGFCGGNILDPAMGTGNFFSVLPESMADSRLYGVEIEPISGSIAKYLYPKAHIQVTGFEHTSYPDQFFDVILGNIPFNSIKVDDPKYNRYNFRIHDYFLAKSLDKTRPGGIVAVITSKYTLDKSNSSIRKYLAQRAELIGAIRLPSNAFKKVAGTEATADILFLKKREREIVPDENNSPWLSVENNTDGIPVNTYFIDHPEMVLGKMVFDERMFGNEKTTACLPIPGDDLDERLGRAISYLDGKYEEPNQAGKLEDMGEKFQGKCILANPEVRNFSYALVEGKVYYREHSRMYEQDISEKKAERIAGMVGIAQAVRCLIEYQNREYGNLSMEEYEGGLQERITKLNVVYDRFVKEYGYINAYANVMAFSRDANAPLLRSIEKEKKNSDEHKEKKEVCYEKTAMFYKATIRPKTIPSVVHSAEDALKISLNIKGRIDLDYMAELYYKPGQGRNSKDEILSELGNQIYQDPVLYGGNPYDGWQTAGEYLSGYVKDKLAEAVIYAEEEPERFMRNVEALRAVQPIPLTPEEISFSLGSPWIPVEIYQDFMYEIFKTKEANRTGRFAIALEFSRYSGAYFIANKGNEESSVTVNQIYGTERMNSYEILEASLNLRFVEVKDRMEYIDPKTGEEKIKYVINKRETILAREKQAQIKGEFEHWLFADPKRGADLTKLYNDKFNNLRPREYDGSGLMLPDLSQDIQLRPHQLDVVAHGLYGEGNLLMAHEVGAGKTYAAIVLTHELKRLGKVAKPLIAVPNHLVGQWSDAYMELYPNANILVAEKKDLQKQNRRRFVGRIAAGDYDCIIMAHSSFELIGMSREHQLAAMKTELDEVTEAIMAEKSCHRKSWSIKQMQIFRKNLQFRYDQLFNAEKKDDVINFEELGVDALIVDEAHAYKNNFSYTKMKNVAGISSQSSQRAMDMHQKCQYINEVGNGKGVVYLTGTPVSNSMAELYVMQKTLQPKELERRGLLMFDAWAGTYGKVTSSLEIKPEGNGYQMKNRFSQFHNLPELMSMFSMIADIKTADMLNLPTPKLKTGSPQVIKSVCTPEQKRIVMELAERAEKIRNRQVDSREDNFLKLTQEARLLSIDPRAIDPGIPDDPNTKLNLCAENVAQIYHETAEKRLTQLIFCDQGTPKYKGKSSEAEESGEFNFYEAVKAALTGLRVKREEIYFIHDAKTDVQREQLFDKIRKGEVRILMGSTEKMGTGMNVQEKLIALHHLDVPWRPSDLTQRNGRILRQGNENEEVSIFNYITENTFDSYLWQILEQKQRYISQIMTGRSALRTCEDLDETVLQYAEFKALAASDPRVKEKMETDNEINRLTVLKSSWQYQQNCLQRDINFGVEKIGKAVKKIAEIEEDLAMYQANKVGEFQMVIGGKIHEERSKAAEHFMVCARRLGMEKGSSLDIGSYASFAIRLERRFDDSIKIYLQGKGSYSVDYGDSELGNIARIVNLADRLETLLLSERNELADWKQQIETAKLELQKPFPEAERLLELQKKKVELDLALEFKEDGEGVIEPEIIAQGFEAVLVKRYDKEEANLER